MTRTALITGGARGIGRAIALRLHADGYAVAFTYYSSREAAGEIEKDFAGHQTPMVGFEGNVSDRKRMTEIVEEVVARFGAIDALVNNAGIRHDVLAYNMTDEQWDDVLNTNLDGAFAVIRSVIPVMMRQRSGAIVNVTSLSGLHGVAGQVNYSAAKGGLIAMSRSLSRELARSGIRVNCVAPGLVDTDMIADLDPETRKEMVRGIPMRRILKPEEVAAVTSFLLSDDASGITGQVITVDGGASA